VIHLSTDYVFDGTNSIPYVETDYTCPVSVYGRSKQYGEQFLRAVCKESVIIRTAWLYSEYGSNFLRTMLLTGKGKKEIGVVSDQIGTPTYAGDLARVIFEMITRSEKDTFVKGIFHYSNEGACSWYDFARKIMELARLDCRVTPIETKDYPTRAIRPQYSMLNKKKIKQTYELSIPHWEESLRGMIGLLTNTPD
jgi:dTDP-4-dehydrorhamnose reductase